MIAKYIRDPSPAQIVVKRERIKTTWSVRERRHRHVGMHGAQRLLQLISCDKPAHAIAVKLG